MSKEEAIAWGKQQQYAGIIENLSGKGDFDCSESLFRFAKAGAGANDQDKDKLKKVSALTLMPSHVVGFCL